MQVDNLNIVIDQVSKDKSLERSVLVEALEQAILSAAKKVFGYERELEAVYNEEIGQVELFQYMVVMAELDSPLTQLAAEDARKVDPDVEVGDELGFQIFYRTEDAERAEEEDKKFGDILGIQQARQAFGRIAAQTAKQVIIQRVREAERDIVYHEYKDRVGEIVTGIARRFERGNIIVDLGRAEAILTTRDQIPRESYRAGDRVQAYVREINRASKGPLIVLSRTSPGMIIKLFEMEVPEIYEGIVTITNVAREPGERAKIAVTSRDSAVDPVGACVGMKGSRVQAVVQELRGEKVDIVPWSPDIAKFICNAIQPADVERVLIDEERNTIELIVPDDHLSLAIGRRGQNVRLASKLVGWKIEITSDKKVSEMTRELYWYMVEERGVEGDLLDYLFKLGYHSPENILNADEEELVGYPGVDLDMAQKLQQLAHEVRKKKDEGTLGLPENFHESTNELTAEGVFGVGAETEEASIDLAAAEAEGADDTAAEAEGADDTAAEAEGADDTAAEAEGADDTVAEAEGADDTAAEAEGADDTAAEAEGADDTAAEADASSDESDTEATAAALELDTKADEGPAVDESKSDEATAA